MGDDHPTEAQTMRIVQNEGLTHWSWFESRSPRADEAGIRRQGDGWLVYSTDERAGEAYRRIHDEEGPALSDFLFRVRANTRYFRRRAERSRQQAGLPSDVAPGE